MITLADLLRVSLQGINPNSEKWSVSPVYSIGGDFGAPVSPSQINAIALAISNVSVPGGILAMHAPATRHTDVRVEARLKTGALEVLGAATRAAPASGTSSSIHPPQTSIVASLRTDLPGPRGRGRLYFPATGVALDTDTFRPTGVLIPNFAAGVKTYLAAIETAIETVVAGATLCVWSRTGSALTPVRSIQAGDVLDTQRRRRDTLVETYSAVTWP